MTFLLDTGPGILILTLVACALVIAGTTIAVTLALAAIVGSLRLLGRLTRTASSPQSRAPGGKPPGAQG